MAINVDMKALLEAGVHFGHRTSRWHPKMAPYIHSKRGDAHIINLEKTAEQLEKVLPEVTKVAAKGQKVLFVGTKKATKEIVKAAAESVKMPYVTTRWMGGMLTNVGTISTQIRKLKDLEKKMDTGELARKYSKLELQRFQEEIDDLNERYGGIREMSEQPAIVFVTDVLVDKNAVKEAKVLNIPVVAIVDTNVDPTEIDHPVPANDDAIAGVKLIVDYVTEAVKAGQAKQPTKANDK
jgi:small subunit ribosomal protein S2